MGLFKSGRELNRLADECAELAGVTTVDMMKLTGNISQELGRPISRGEVLVVMLESLRLLDETRSPMVARMMMADRFDDGEMTDQTGRPLRDRVPAEMAAQILLFTTNTFRPHYQD